MRREFADDPMMGELHKIREKHYRQTTSSRGKGPPPRKRRLFAQRLQAESRLVQADSRALLLEIETTLR